MDAFQFIEAAKKEHIYLVVNNRNLEVKNASKLLPKSRAFIRLHKPEIIAAIAANDELETMIASYRHPQRELPKAVGVMAEYLDRSQHKKEPSHKMIDWLGNKWTDKEAKDFEKWLERTQDHAWAIHYLRQQAKRNRAAP